MLLTPKPSVGDYPKLLKEAETGGEIILFDNTKKIKVAGPDNYFVSAAGSHFFTIGNTLHYKSEKVVYRFTEEFEAEAVTKSHYAITSLDYTNEAFVIAHTSSDELSYYDSTVTEDEGISIITPGLKENFQVVTDGVLCATEEAFYFVSKDGRENKVCSNPKSEWEFERAGKSCWLACGDCLCLCDGDNILSLTNFKGERILELDTKEIAIWGNVSFGYEPNTQLICARTEYNCSTIEKNGNMVCYHNIFRDYDACFSQHGVIIKDEGVFYIVKPDNSRIDLGAHRGRVVASCKEGLFLEDDRNTLSLLVIKEN